MVWLLYLVESIVVIPDSLKESDDHHAEPWNNNECQTRDT
jgi:hypothetical protein